MVQASLASAQRVEAEHAAERADAALPVAQPPRQLRAAGRRDAIDLARGAAVRRLPFARDETVLLERAQHGVERALTHAQHVAALQLDRPRDRVAVAGAACQHVQDQEAHLVAAQRGRLAHRIEYTSEVKVCPVLIAKTPRPAAYAGARHELRPAPPLPAVPARRRRALVAARPVPAVRPETARAAGRRREKRTMTTHAQELERYRSEKKESYALYGRAEKVLPLGVSSNFRTYEPYPIYIQRAQGSKMWDVDGREYTDFSMCFGALMVGHSHPVMVEAIAKAASEGTLYGMPHD